MASLISVQFSGATDEQFPPGVDSSYGYGAGMQLNALLDGSTRQIFYVLVTGKHVSSGRSTSYHLQLAQWGPNTSGQDLMVPSSV